MNALLPFLITAGIFLVVVIIAWYASVLEKRRTEAFKQFADEVGLEFVPVDSTRLRSIRSQFSLFSRGSVQVIKNVIVGDSGEVEIASFDFHYESGTGKNKTTSKQTVAVINSKQLKLPEFQLRPESILDKVGAFLGMADINFDNHPQFSAAFVLQGPDVEAIRKLFTAKILDFFVSRPGIHVEGGPAGLLIYRKTLRTPEEIRAVLAEAYEIFGLFVDR